MGHQYLGTNMSYRKKRKKKIQNLGDTLPPLSHRCSPKVDTISTNWNSNQKRLYDFIFLYR